ncbi:hypothetical protein ACFLZV_06650, partial [Candidatus Margulisiibacteriota bacterium]
KKNNAQYKSKKNKTQFKKTKFLIAILFMLTIFSQNIFCQVKTDNKSLLKNDKTNNRIFKRKSKYKLNRQKQLFGFNVSLQNLDSTLRLTNFPMYYFTYGKKIRHQTWFYGVGYSFAEKKINGTIVLSNPNEVILIDKLSTFSIIAGMEFIKDFYCKGSGELIFFNNHSTKTTLNGLSVSGEFGKPLEMADYLSLIPYVGVNFTYISTVTVKGKRGPLNPGFFGMGISAGVKTLFMI